VSGREEGATFMTYIPTIQRPGVKVVIHMTFYNDVNDGA